MHSLGMNRGIGVFMWDTASFANEEYAPEWGVEMGNGSVTAMATTTAALAGISATAMAEAGGEGGDLVMNKGLVDTDLLDTS